MIIAGKYSFNGGMEYVDEHFPNLYKEVEDVISLVDSKTCVTKSSKEKTMAGKMLYSPRALNNLFKIEFKKYGWAPVKEPCVYPTQYYTSAYKPKPIKGRPHREMDFVKDRLGVEVQFGKYAFMVYNVAAKMTIFKKLGHIRAGIEIVPIKEFADEMSTGVSYFEQFVWDLGQRGNADIDIPVLILGIHE